MISVQTTQQNVHVPPQTSGDSEIAVLTMHDFDRSSEEGKEAFLEYITKLRARI